MFSFLLFFPPLFMMIQADLLPLGYPEGPARIRVHA